MTLTTEIEDIKQKSLKPIATQKGQRISEFVSEILDDYLRQNITEDRELHEFMKLSETSFSDWDNEEDNIYDHL